MEGEREVGDRRCGWGLVIKSHLLFLSRLIPDEACDAFSHYSKTSLALSEEIQRLVSVIKSNDKDMSDGSNNIRERVIRFSDVFALSSRDPRSIF